MNVPPQIIFHDMDRSQWIEDYIHERLQHLEKISDGVTSAHVVLTRSQGSHQHGNEYRVTVEVRFPPHHDLAAKKERNIGDAQVELRPLIKQAFEAIERQVKEVVQKRRHEVKAHDSFQNAAIPGTMPDSDDDALDEPRTIDEVAKQNERSIHPQANPLK